MNAWWLRSDWIQSIGVHIGIVIIFLVGTLLSQVTSRLWMDEPVLITAPIEIKISVNSPIQNKIVEKPKPRAVFGASKKSMFTKVETNQAVVETKLGNTLTKSQDNQILDPALSQDIPIPTDEYLISKMPILIDEVRISYPAEAAAKSIQGPVELELLIDAKGNVREMKTISAPDPILEFAAREAIIKFRFKPAEVDGNPVAVRIRYIYRFKIER